MFVAGFIGSPAMNLCTCRVGATARSRSAEARRCRCRRASTGATSVVVGVRPEALELAADGVPARVEVVEELGADAYVFCTAEVPAARRGSSPAPTPRRQPARRAVRLRPRGEEAHLFDAASGDRLGCQVALSIRAESRSCKGEATKEDTNMSRIVVINPSRSTASRRPGRRMKQYLLSVYQPDGDPPPPEVLDADHARRRRAATQRDQGRRRLGLRRRACTTPSTATVVRSQDGEVLTTDGPFAEGKEHIGGFTIIKAPDLDAALEWGAQARAGRPRCRSRCGRSEGARTDAGVPDRRPEIERVFREEYGRAVAVLVRVFGDIDIAEEAVQDAFADGARSAGRPAGLPPSPAGWIITTARNRAIDRLRREASREDRHAQAAAAARAATSRRRRAPCATTGCA